MSNPQRLSAIRAIHLVVYLAMTASVFAVLYAGVTGACGAWLWIAMSLLALEAGVLATNELRCPLTTLAIRYGAEKGHCFDPFLSEKFARRTFALFGTMAAVGLGLLVSRWLSGIG